MASKLIFLSLLLFVSARPKIEEPEILCLDDLEDYQTRNWYGMDARVIYAETSKQLPAGLDEQPGLEIGDGGVGIFYFQGTNSSSQWLRKDRWDGWISGDKEVYMYLRYYGHVVQEQPGQNKLTAYPALTSNIDYPYADLPPTSNFSWHEEVIELSPGFVNAYGMGVGAAFYQQTDFLLVEKLIVVEGPEGGNSVEDLRGLCPPKRN